MSELTPNLVLPTPEQLDWAQGEIGVIIHLDVQVFEPGYSFREHWGYTPDPSVFNPVELDTDQWIATAKSAGATYAVLVAKHCSGFSLWPTTAHDYNVQASPWRDGKGDIVADFIRSCRKYGLRPGLYCSASTNAYLNVDNPGKVRSGDPAEQARYNHVVETQLTELWSNYGEVFYIWFDGGVMPPEAGGPAIVPLLKQLQPRAVVYQGPHDWPSLTRFVGNERAEAPDPFWNTTSDLTSDDGTVEKDGLGGNPNGTRWVPGESDMPNRCQKRAFQGGWFWRKDEERFLYSLNHMVEHYFTSIGRNTNLLIGMVIDPRGLVPEADERRFAEFGERMKQIFSNRVASAAGNGNAITLPLPKGSAPNMLVLMEDIAQGERVRKFVVEARMDNEWVPVWGGTCIGHKKIERFEPMAATELRLTVVESVAEPQILEFSAWSVDDALVDGPLDMAQRCHITIRRNAGGEVELRCSNPALALRYTLDGTEPGAGSPIYGSPIPLLNGGTVRTCAFINNRSRGPTVTAVFGVDRRAWRVVSTSLDSPFANGGQAGVAHLLTDDPKTYWHTFHKDKTLSAPPHEVVLSMGREHSVAAFTFLPRDIGTCEGTPDDVAFYLSLDGQHWTLATECKFPDVRENFGMRHLPLPKPIAGRYLRFVAKHVIDDCNYVVVAGIGAIETR